MITILCIVVLLVCGSLLSQGFLESVDDVGSGYEELASVDKDLRRTNINIDYAFTAGSKIIRVDLSNTGNNKLSDFNNWVVIAEYYDDNGHFYTKWLNYTSEMLSFNQWKIDNITFNNKPEVFEPGILNSQENMSLSLLLEPLPAWDTIATIYVTTPNGVRDFISFQVVPGDFVLTPHSDTMIVGDETYFTLKEAVPADGPALIQTTGTIGKWETGRWLLYSEDDPTLTARHIYPLNATGEIPAYNWNIFYRGYAVSGWQDNPYISIDIIVRKADGSIREVIGTDVARAYIATFNTWLTISTSYAFPGYEVVDNTDYLEIDFYAGADGRGSNQNANYIKLIVDDSSLPETDQTRIQ